MTDELDAILDRPVRCENCDETVSLARTQNGSLVVRCACDDAKRSLKVARVLPEGWT